MGQRIKGEFLFVIYALVFGMLLVFLIPPMNTPDEGVHFLNAYAVSKGDFWGTVKDGQYVREYPTSVSEFETRFSKRFGLNYDDKMEYSEILAETENREGPEGTTLRGSIASPTGYLVSGFGMAVGSVIGKLFHNAALERPYNKLIFGRIANLLFYVFVTFFALKMIPCFKRTMFLLAMMPMTLFQGASLSYDAVLIPVIFLFIAVVCKLLHEKDCVIRRGETALVLFCAFFMMTIKQAYAPLLLLLLAIPRKKYGTTKNLVLCIAAVVGVSVLAYVPQWIIQRNSASAMNAADAAAIQTQSEWVRGNIAKLPGIFLNTFVHANGYVDSFWGRLGRLDTVMPKPLVMGGLLILLITAVFEACGFSFFGAKDWWKRLLPLAADVIIVFGIMFVMYRDYTPLPYVSNTIGGDTVVGFQGRYLIPLFLPFFLALMNRFSSFAAGKMKIAPEKRSSIKVGLDYTVYFWAFFCGLFTVLFVFLRFWV